MRLTDSDNRALLDQAQHRARLYQALNERKAFFCAKFDELYALAQKHRATGDGPLYREELWALKQAIYLVTIEERERIHQLNECVRLLEARTGQPSAQIRKLIEPPFTGV